MFGAGLEKYLATNPAVIAVLGAARGDNTNGVFPQLAPKGTPLPYIVYMQIAGEPVESMAGMNRLATARYRLSCYGASYKDTEKLAEAVRGSFSVTTVYQGALPDADATVLQSAKQLLEMDDSEPVPHGTVYATHLDFEYMYKNNS